MGMLMVNGAAVPAPTALTATVFDVASNVSRNAAGNAVMDLQAVKRKLELSWAHMDGAALATLLEAMNGFFEVDYPDPQSGEQRRMTCYCSERVAGILRMANGTPVWTDVKMSWTER